MEILFCSPSFHKSDVVTLGRYRAMPVLRLYLQLHPSFGQQEEWDRDLLDLSGQCLLHYQKSHCCPLQSHDIAVTHRVEKPVCLSSFLLSISPLSCIDTHSKLWSFLNKKFLQNKVLIQNYRKLMGKEKSHVCMITKNVP